MDNFAQTKTNVRVELTIVVCMRAVKTTQVLTSVSAEPVIPVMGSTAPTLMNVKRAPLHAIRTLTV